MPIYYESRLVKLVLDEAERPKIEPMAPGGNRRRRPSPNWAWTKR